ncbi:MAG: Gfo/Idh/MocA family oxidoreductase [Novosphingobium sp.]|nr:Gfo/Idh/MocA family oxidoreductase [Novosphingobium sp.]
MPRQPRGSLAFPTALSSGLAAGCFAYPAWPSRFNFRRYVYPALIGYVMHQGLVVPLDEGDSRVRILVIGSGFGSYAMAPVYQSHGCEVEVVSPRDGEAVSSAMAGEFDLVSIHSPPFMHKDHVLLALSHGKPVLCDKPFGLDEVEARAMRDAARESGSLNFLNCEFRMKPTHRKMKELVEAGAVGKPVHIHLNFFSNGLRGREHRWLNDRELGGGWIGAYGSHFVDTLRWFFGSEIADCGGLTRVDTRMRPGPDGGEAASTAEDAYSAWFLMANGGTANIDSCYSGPVPIAPRMTIIGSDGALELVGETQLFVRRAIVEEPGVTLTRDERIRRAVGADTPDEVITFPPNHGETHEPALTPWLAKVLQAVRDGRQITPDFEEGVVMADALALWRSNAVRL